MQEQKYYSAIVPAYNEEKTIEKVVRTFLIHPWCYEVIVISDGSNDKTAEVAKNAGAQVLALEKNIGKGGAVEIGVRLAKMDVLFFSDADILGLDEKIISKIALPVLEEKCAMSIGIQKKSVYWLNRILHFFPVLGGERVLTKDLWYSVPPPYRTNFKIETALNYYSKKFGRTAHFILFPEMRQVKKEIKYGFLRGFWLRIKMSLEVFNISFRLYIVDSMVDFLSIKILREIKLILSREIF